ncbi:hypothetical protein JCM19240_6165 [Vibrio maritimus]|uniref:Uncharacterized protein n=1 Tax=Vibrio maritimus TaxID=990268 RepID=A0A090T0L4_9VIBR|nr:hypothetical protein JCM19240_6165 [Vibrio maritimus]
MYSGLFSYWSEAYYHPAEKLPGIIDNFDVGLLPFSAAQVHLCAQKGLHV